MLVVPCGACSLVDRANVHLCVSIQLLTSCVLLAGGQGLEFERTVGQAGEHGVMEESTPTNAERRPWPGRSARLGTDDAAGAWAEKRSWRFLASGSLPMMCRRVHREMLRACWAAGLVFVFGGLKTWHDARPIVRPPRCPILSPPPRSPVKRQIDARLSRPAGLAQTGNKAFASSWSRMFALVKCDALGISHS